jgi:hypothetical protein
LHVLGGRDVQEDGDELGVCDVLALLRWVRDGGSYPEHLSVFDMVAGTHVHVCRVKVLDLQWVEIPPATGSLQPVAIEATRGGNETVGAFETDGSLWRLGEPTGRNASER